MKINYPVKYAAMPIIEQVGWSHGLHQLERNYDVVCYIVSKCYLITEATQHKEDGNTIKEYEVVFPYQPVEFNRWKRVIPTYNLMHGYCTNSNKVDRVFNSYEETEDYVKSKNEELCKNTYKYLFFSDDILDRIQTKKEEFADKLEEYKVLEQQILFNTEDIQIGENKKLDNVIRMQKQSGKILSCNIYRVLELFADEKFIIYNISQEQHNALIKIESQLKKEEISSIISEPKGLAVHKTRGDIIQIASGGYYIKNNKMFYSCDLDSLKKEDFENIDEDTLIFYTTETIDDLLNSYKKETEIDFDTFKGPILKKSKK